MNETVSRPIRILYMEDDPGLARLFQRRLERAGYQVDLAKDGEEGLAMLDLHPYHILIADHIMPGRTGLEVLAELAARGPVPPFVMVTGAGNEEIAVESMKLGASDYIIKDGGGLYMEILPQIIPRILQHQRLQAEKLAAEEALRASEQKFRSLVEQSSDGIVLTNEQGKIIEWNQAAEQILSLPRSEALGRPFWDVQYQLAPKAFQTPENYQQLKREMQTVFETGQAPWWNQIRENEIQRLDGSTRWIQAVVFPIHAQEDLTAGSFIRDVTELKAIENRLKEREEQLNRLLEAIPAGILIIDPEIRLVTDANPSALEMIGCSRQELLGTPCQQLFTQQSGACAADNESITRYSEIQLIRADQSKVPILKTVVPIFYNGRLQLLESLTDISDIKQAEKALIELNATLEAKVEARTAEIKAEKEKSEIILRNVADAIGMVDMKLRVQYVNQAFCQLTGYQAHEILGQSMYRLIGAKPSESELQSMRETLMKGDAWQGEAVARRQDGRTYEADITIAPMRDADGKIIGFVSSHRDISAANDLIRARTSFLTNVSHELRTPVANLKLYTHMLQQELSAEKNQAYLTTLKGQVERLSNLVQDILTMTDLDSGLAAGSWKPLIFTSMIQDLLTRFHDQAQAAGFELSAQALPKQLPSVNGDQTRVTQALGELVQNSLTFTPPRGQINISVAAVQDQGKSWVTIAVQDTGPGIPAKEQEQIFDRFFRGSVAESGHIPGTGLGLSMVYEIMAAHNGRVTVDSQPGQGSTFTLWLPTV